MTLFSRFQILALALMFFCALPAVAQAQGMPSIIRDAEIENGLYDLTQPVFDAAGIGRNDVRLILLQDPGLNAFVAGGMNIFLYTGVILEAENPGELLGVLSHETGHIAGAHLVRTARVMEQASFQAILASILGVATAAATGNGGAAGAIFSGGTTMAQQGFLAQASADQAAVKYLSDAGYNATGLLTFLQKLQAEDVLPAARRSEYLYTHPLTSNRISFLQTRVERTADKPSQNEQTQEMFRRMQAKLVGFIYPEQALRYTADTVANRYARAIAHYRKNDLNQALADLNGLIAEEPNNPYFHELKGQILFENGKIKDSLGPYARAVELAPSADLIRANYGQSLLADNQYQPAVNQLERALKTEGRSPLVHRLLATAYGRLEDHGSSRVHLAEEALLQQKYDDARRQAGLARQVMDASHPKWIRLQDIQAVLDNQRDN